MASRVQQLPSCTTRLLLFLDVGTNDIYDVSVSTEEVANSIFNLAEVIHHQSKTQRRVIVQVLHRHPPSVAVRYPVDVDLYNSRVDQLNKRLGDFASTMPCRHCFYIYWPKGQKKGQQKPDKFTNQEGQKHGSRTAAASPGGSSCESRCE